ncbi:MAG: gliding motility-associated ABC transporter permease subunit GldF [Chitinophagaceae bacterium]|nr:gliding motility-associated ABC transporter permease subunit GldF [Chitinophagaceae bacterium]
MISIYKKELNLFFSSLVGYIAIIVFLLVCGFFMWVVPDSNMLEYGYATMDKFFISAPWILMFLLPALTMRSFADEYKGGTIEILSTLPLKESQIILGKFLASLTLMVFSLLPTLIYVFTLSSLSVVANNLDTGGITGSYIGLFFLSAAFTAVGTFCSSLTSNQVIAFLMAVFTNFILYSGFDTLSRMPFVSGTPEYIISQIGMQFHYASISRGLLDTRDIVYFISVTIIFLTATSLSLQKRKWN